MRPSRPACDCPRAQVHRCPIARALENRFSITVSKDVAGIDLLDHATLPVVGVCHERVAILVGDRRQSRSGAVRLEGDAVVLRRGAHPPQAVGEDDRRRVTRRGRNGRAAEQDEREDEDETAHGGPLSRA